MNCNLTTSASNISNQHNYLNPEASFGSAFFILKSSYASIQIFANNNSSCMQQLPIVQSAFKSIVLFFQGGGSTLSWKQSSLPKLYKSPFSLDTFPNQQRILPNITLTFGPWHSSFQIQKTCHSFHFFFGESFIPFHHSAFLVSAFTNIRL